MFSFDLFPFLECFKKKYRKPFWKIIENYLVKSLFITKLFITKYQNQI